MCRKRSASTSCAFCRSPTFWRGLYGIQRRTSRFRSCSTETQGNTKMATANLNARTRDERKKGGSRKLRAAGRIPAVIYGHGEQTRALSVDAHEIERLFSSIHRENT